MSDSIRLSGKPSRSGDAARHKELERIKAMSPRERALLALRLGQRDRYLLALAKRKPSP